MTPNHYETLSVLCTGINPSEIYYHEPKNPSAERAEPERSLRNVWYPKRKLRPIPYLVRKGAKPDEQGVRQAS